MDTRTGGRGLEIATAIALGVVSVVTALGVLQASVWNDSADRFASDSADARDQSITLDVVAQLKQRSDLAALLEARLLAREQDEAIAAGDLELALDLEARIGTALGNSYHLPEGSFVVWRESGYPEEQRPTDSSEYLVRLRGDVDALTLASQQLGAFATQLKDKSATFGQAALVHALALFLFGVAGINRLRSARYVTLAMGGLVFLFGLFLMSTAY